MMIRVVCLFCARIIHIVGIKDCEVKDTMKTTPMAQIACDVVKQALNEANVSPRMVGDFLGVNPLELKEWLHQGTVPLDIFIGLAVASHVSLTEIFARAKALQAQRMSDTEESQTVPTKTAIHTVQSNDSVNETRAVEYIHTSGDVPFPNIDDDTISSSPRSAVTSEDSSPDVLSDDELLDKYDEQAESDDIDGMDYGIDGLRMSPFAEELDFKKLGMDGAQQCVLQWKDITVQVVDKYTQADTRAVVADSMPIAQLENKEKSIVKLLFKDKASQEIFLDNNVLNTIDDVVAHMSLNVSFIMAVES